MNGNKKKKKDEKLYIKIIKLYPNKKKYYSSKYFLTLMQTFNIKLKEK